MYDWAKPTPSPIPGQTDPETGAAVSVPSAPCIVFAHDRPEFDLIDESNPATGGIRLSYSGLTEPTTDLMNKCPPSPIYGGGESPRFLHINLLCDPRQEDLATGAWLFNEVSTCVYEFNVTTKYACGIAGDPYAPPVAAAATPGKNFGFTVLGAVLTVGGYAAFLWADSRGYLDAVRARLPSVLRGGDAGYKAAGSSSSSSSAGFVRSGGAYGSA